MSDWIKIENMPADFEGDAWIVSEEIKNPVVILCETWVNRNGKRMFCDYGGGDRAEEWDKVTHYIPLIEPQLPVKE